MEARIADKRQKMFLESYVILKYLVLDDDEVDTLIMCKSAEIQLITTDYNLHEAIGSIKKEDNFKLNKLAKFFEVVKVISYENINQKPKPILKDERMIQLRKKVFGG